MAVKHESRSEPSPDSLFVVPIFLPEPGLKVTFLAPDDAALDGNDGQGQQQQRPPGIRSQRDTYVDRHFAEGSPDYG